MIQKKLFCIFLILSFISGKSQHNVILEALDAPSDPQFTIVGCATALGYLAQGLPANSLDIAAGQQMQVNVIVPGPYNFTTNTANGVSFSASGTFTGTGLQTVTLIASGTPINYSINNNINVYLYSVVNTTGTNAGSCAFFRKTYLPDQNYTGTIRNDGQHRFLYKVITGPGNKQWLQTNLGAHYNQVGHPSFNPEMSATGVDDYLAFGSLFQLGRNSDGHELVNWASATAVTSSSSFVTYFNFPTTGDFNSIQSVGAFVKITNPSATYQGSSLPAATAIAGRIVVGPGMPCPVGFHLAEPADYAAANGAGESYWINSPLKLVAPKIYRSVDTGSFTAMPYRLLRRNNVRAFPTPSPLSNQYSIEGIIPEERRSFVTNYTDDRGPYDGYPVRCFKP
jgi:hypothetical protein